MADLPDPTKLACGTTALVVESITAGIRIQATLGGEVETLDLGSIATDIFDVVTGTAPKTPKDILIERLEDMLDKLDWDADKITGTIKRAFPSANLSKTFVERVEVLIYAQVKGQLYKVDDKTYFLRRPCAKHWDFVSAYENDDLILIGQPHTFNVGVLLLNPDKKVIEENVDEIIRGFQQIMMQLKDRLTRTPINARAEVVNQLKGEADIIIYK